MCTKIQLILNTLDQESAKAYEKEIVHGIETSLRRAEREVLFLWRSVMNVYRTTSKTRWQIADDKDWQVVDERHELQLYLKIIPYRLNLEVGRPCTFACNVTHIMPAHLQLEYIRAVKRSDLSHIQDMLSSGALSLYSENEYGASLLHLAASHGNKNTNRPVYSDDRARLDQFEFAETFQEWLSIVESCGLDQRTYLEHLMPWFADYMEDGDLIGNGDNARLQQFIHVRYDVTYGSVMGPGWTWWVDPDSPAGLVLQEFQCFDVAIVSWKNILSWNGGRLNDFAPRATDGVIWPTTLEMWEQVMDTTRGSYTEIREARQLRDARFARRQAKKDRKAGRTSKVCKMPGSWVD
ncbi:uncharacterized protein E0L32_009026 [Thyridium curvatum]|uniref:Uncharacterized protein n=1 Tax=Thyridium curvatum TaxID=1093900 RepID=A0A507AI96_9PEZI|nr:uncharacterized protein E0L32_009026 [Thyridium curvatum]TPX09835.1 hypothetical protein E0L32_009026 [Thyridium curvatum]